MNEVQPSQSAGAASPLQGPEGLLRPSTPAASSENPSPSATTPTQPPAKPPSPSVVLPPASIIPKGGKRSFKKLIIGILLVIIVTVGIIFFLSMRQAQEKATLTWWGLWEDEQTVTSIITEFEKDNPQIDVTYSRQDPKQYRERLATRVELGTGPDVFYYHNTWYPMLSQILLPLSTDVITPEAFKGAYYPVMQSDLIQNGAIYGIPSGADSLSLFINTELFQSAGVKPPTNWDEFVNVSKTLTIKDENGKIKTSGAALGTMSNITHASDIVSLLFLQQGVDMRKFSATTQEQVDSLVFYTSFAKGGQNTWDETLDDSRLAFSKGNLAMYFGYSWDIFEIQKRNKNLSFTAHPVPQLVDKKTTVASYWVNGVSSESKQRKAALLFLAFLAKKETQEKLYSEASKVRGFGQPYARVDLAGTLRDNNLVFPFVEQLPDARSSFFASDTHDGEGGLNSSLNAYLVNAINAMQGSTSAESAVRTLHEGVAQVFEKYGIR